MTFSRLKENARCRRENFCGLALRILRKLTNLIAKDILLKGMCDLPSLEESFLTHKPMLNSFIKHVNLINKTKVTKCKIT